MNDRTRVFAFTLIVSLLVVPAVTRVYQRLERGGSGRSLIASYIKSAEAPPEKLLAAPRTLLTAVILCDLLAGQIPVALRPPAGDVPLSFKPLAPPDALRAPPRA